MNLRLFKLSTVLAILLSQVFSQVIITEVMYDPDEKDSEFVEIYNTTADSINLAGWTIDDKKGTDFLEIVDSILTIPPSGYAVILEEDYFTSPRIYSSIIPDSVLMIKVNGSICYRGLAISDSLYLINNLGDIVDSVKWKDPAPDGYSIEKVWLLDQPNTADNWKASKESLGTPGVPNSVAPLNINGAISDNIIFTPTFPKPGESIVAKVTVENIGISTFTGTITASLNGNIIGTENVPLLSSRETTTINIPLGTLPSGRHKITFELSVAGDGDIADNTATKKLGVSYTPGSVKINEFHAKPGENQIEFVELVSLGSIVMDGWIISDNSSGKLIPITYIEVGEYAVLASDTSLKSISNPDAHYLIPYGGLPTLNNTGDGIFLLDMNRTVIDSLIYGSGWPVVEDTSAEKLRPDILSNDPANWSLSTAVAKMTPGYVNSNYLIDYDGAIIADSVYHTPEFPKSDESVELFIPVTNHGAQAISGAVIVSENYLEIGSIGFTDIARRDTSILQISLPTMNSGIHPLQIKLEIATDQNLKNNTATDTIFVSYNFGDVLINEFLARPTSPQAEFVELITFENVDLTNWSIADKTTTLHHFNGGGIAADKYVVLSEDIAFATIIPQEANFIEVENFPSLNNYGDTIYLRDFTGVVIDSLIYTTWWDLATGKSTEKIHPEFVSNDSTGWRVSTDSTGWTPGAPNSVVAKYIDGAIFLDDIVFSPEFPESTDPIFVTIPIINNGLQSISGNLIVMENNLTLTISIFNEISMSDTILIELEIPPIPSGRHEITISLNINSDENIENNMASIPILVSYKFGDVTINEFLADPESPLSEFVEIIAQETVDLNGWAISDNRKELEDFSAGLIQSSTYVVLSEDTSLAVLLPSKSNFINI